MSDYSKTVNFAAKDALISGDPNKVIKGTELNTEFDAIATASATKADSDSPTFTGTMNTALLISTVDDASNTASTSVHKITHTTSGSPGVGIGVGIDFIVEAQAASNEIGMVLQTITTNVGSTTEDFDFVVLLMAAGAAAAEKFRVSSAGAVVMSGGSLTDSSGAISFGDENLTTTGNFQATTGGFGIARTEGTLHVHTATAGAATPSTSADDLIIENSATTGISILSPDTSSGVIYFGSPSVGAGAGFDWKWSTSAFKINTFKVGAAITINSDNSVTNLTLAGASGSETAVFAGTVTATDGLTITAGNLTVTGDVILTSAVTTTNALTLTAAAMTTGKGIHVIANALTQGMCAHFYSNSADTDGRQVVFIENDHADSANCVAIKIQQDSIAPLAILDRNADGAFFDYQGTAGASTTNPISTHGTQGTRQGHIQIEINGTKRWVPFYDDPSA